MTLNARRIALQGIGFGAASTAVQGFDSIQIVIHEGGVLKETIWDNALPKERLLHRDRLIAEDQLATEFILALLSSGILNVERT